MEDEYRSKRARRPRNKIGEAALSYETGWEEPVLMTISSKNQITLPIHLLRELGLGPGDRLAVALEGNRLILRPRPKNWATYYAGSLKGLYGNTVEEIDDYVRQLRDDSRRQELIEEAWDGKRTAAKE